MNFEDINDIKRSSFQGFLAISALRTSKCQEVSDEPGVYLVLRPNKARPRFRRRNSGGHFKGKDPTVGISQLKGSWVEKALVLYIGKAGGPGKKVTLRSRLRLYMRFGRGAAVAHSGGRYIWQLRQSGRLLVCWKQTFNANPRDVEKELIQEFKAKYDGRRPFANLAD